VKFQALAAQKRDSMPTEWTSPAGEDDEEEKCAARHGFLGHNELHTKSVLHRGYQILTDFMQFSKKKHGNAMRTWFHLDPDEHMRIGQMQFIRQVQEMGFHGNPHAMWKYLDSQQTGTITILELDPPSAMLLSGFKHLMNCMVGPKIDRAEFFNFFDLNRSGKIYKKEFVSVINELGYRGPSQHLFNLLDRHRSGWINTRDLLFLDRWYPPPYLFSTPNFDLLQAVKDALKHVHVSILRGWRKVLDRDSNMRISWAEFSGAFRHLSDIKTLPVELQKRLPKNLEDLSSAWRALDAGCAGWAALREFDEASFQILREFKRWAVENHGSLYKAFHDLDNANGKLTMNELKRGLKGEKTEFRGDIEFLFEALDVGNVGTLSEHEVKFLDAWDIDWEDWEVSTKNRSKQLFDLAYGCSSRTPTVLASGSSHPTRAHGRCSMFAS